MFDVVDGVLTVHVIDLEGLDEGTLHTCEKADVSEVVWEPMLVADEELNLFCVADPSRGVVDRDGEDTW